MKLTALQILWSSMSEFHWKATTSVSVFALQSATQHTTGYWYHIATAVSNKYQKRRDSVNEHTLKYGDTLYCRQFCSDSRGTEPVKPGRQNVWSYRYWQQNESAANLKYKNNWTVKLVILIFCYLDIWLIKTFQELFFLFNIMEESYTYKTKKI